MCTEKEGAPSWCKRLQLKSDKTDLELEPLELEPLELEPLDLEQFGLELLDLEQQIGLDVSKN